MAPFSHFRVVSGEYPTSRPETQTPQVDGVARSGLAAHCVSGLHCSITRHISPGFLTVAALRVPIKFGIVRPGFRVRFFFPRTSKGMSSVTLRK